MTAKRKRTTTDRDWKGRVAGAVLLLTTGGAACGATTTYPDVDLNMELRPVTGRVYYVEGVPGVATDNAGFISNAGVIFTDQGVVVFDALGSPSLAWKLLGLIRAKTDKPVVKVVVSHYHADHIYGLQVFKDLGAEIIAPEGATDYLNSEVAEERLEERRFSLEPWVDETTRLVPPDREIAKSMSFELGGVRFLLNYLGKAHSDGDLAMLVEPDRVLFSGDVIFQGRVPYVGNADTRAWLQTLQRLDTGGLTALVPGHGPMSPDPVQLIAMTGRYLAYLRKTMGAAVEEFTPFDEAYADTDWSEFSGLPAFDAANRINAYQVYLSMEAELLGQ